MISDDQTLRIERTFQAPAEAVFDAWTSEEVMRRWWQAEHGWETTEAEVDLRVGGAVRVVMRDPEKDVEYGGGGYYTEIDPPSRLAFTWLWDDDTRRTLIEIDFEETDGVTTVRFTHSGLWDEEAVRSPRGRLEQALRQPRAHPGGGSPGRVASAAQMPEALDRTVFEPVFKDDFSGPDVDPDRWVAHYLPHWTTPDRSAARYDLDPAACGCGSTPTSRPGARGRRDARLEPPDRDVRRPGRLAVGQHRHRPDLACGRPARGGGCGRRRRARRGGPRASARPDLHAGGLARRASRRLPSSPGEICVAELYGHAVGPGRSGVRIGVKAHHDPRLREDMVELTLDLDATD